MLSKCDCCNTEYMFDEGVFQLIWAIYLRSETNPVDEKVVNIMYCFGMPDKLIIIDADDLVIKGRLMARGIKTKILENPDLLGKIAEMKRVLEKIVRVALDERLFRLEQIECWNNNRKRDIYAK